MDHVAVRPARAEDVGRVLAINAEGQPGVSALTPAELAEALAGATYFCVAEAESRVVGYIIAYTAGDTYDGEEFAWFQRAFGGFLYIDQVAVASTARRSRVGAQMYQQAEQYARKRGLTSLVCEVNLEPPNPASLDFHTARQFAEVGVLDTQDGRKVSLRRRPLG